MARVLQYSPGFVRGSLLAIAGLCIAIEGVLLLSDYGVLGWSRLRFQAYAYGGFWPGLLAADWQANYAAQPYLMFLTYGFLHGGLIHLTVNMITLMSLGREVITRVGQRGFLVIYCGAIFGGALGFGLLAAGMMPMVGASGALFGLAGAVLAWNSVDRLALSEHLWPVGRAALFLVVLNVVLWWSTGGLVAWQTHLGGFVTGWALALIVDPSNRVPKDQRPPESPEGPSPDR